MRSVTEKAVAGLCALGLLLILWSAAAWTPFHDWNGARLYPAYLLAAGEQLYHPAGTGVVNGWIYGPGLPLLLALVTFIPAPTWAMVAAAWLNIAVLFVPVVLILQAVIARGLSRGRQWWLALFTVAALLLLPTTARRLIFITCDQLAIGLGCASCFVLYRATQAAGRRADILRWLAASTAVAAIWTKQTEVMIPVAQVAFLLLQGSRRLALRYLAELTALVLLSVAVMAAWAGGEALWFNLVWIPSHHPLATGAQSLGARLLWGTLYGLPFAALAAWGLRRPSDAGSAETRPLARLFLLAGGAMFVTGVLAAAKVGGDENSFHFVYYLAIAAAAAWAGPVRDRLARPDTVGPALAGVAGVALAAWALSQEAPARLAPAPSLDRALALAAGMPGQVLFPRNPLVTWITERKQYQHEWGVFDQNLAGVPLRFGPFWDGMPPHLNRVVYPMRGRYFFMQLMPDLKEEAVLPDLAVYTVGPRPAPPPAR